MTESTFSHSSAGRVPLRARVFNLTVLGISFALLFLLLKENEGRVAAEEKLKDMRYQVETVSSEKEGVILTLESRIGELENRLQEAQFANQQLTVDSQKQIDELKVQLEQFRQRYDEMLAQKSSEITDLEKKASEDSVKFGALVKEKNAEVADLSTRLKDASARMDELVRKKQELETKNLAIADELTLTKNGLKSLERQHAELAGAVREAQAQKQIKD